MGPMLLQHLAQENAPKFGVNVPCDAVLDGLHTLYLIVEAAGIDKVDEFMSPFSQMGTVEIWPSNSCEAVVSRGHC